MIALPVLSVIIIFIVAWWWNNNTSQQWKTPKKAFPKNWRLILIQNVAFYNALSREEKDQFEYRVQEFLLNCKITGVKTKVKDIDKVLIGSSAIIPIFKFPNWRYNNINEVLVYPESFNKKFQTEGPNRNILGMVGSGYMEGKMILSQKALHHGFKNTSDKKNTAIHEFVHLIDKTDGSIDGIPELLLDNQYLLPWIDLINQKIEEIYEGDSDINPYGATNQAEFFSVISEYFFERPQLLEKNHPELYKLLEQIFNQDMSEKNLKKTSSRIGRNDPCPCGSGRKFKRCCGKQGVY